MELIARLLLGAGRTVIRNVPARLLIRTDGDRRERWLANQWQAAGIDRLIKRNVMAMMPGRGFAIPPIVIPGRWKRKKLA